MKFSFTIIAEALQRAYPEHVLCINTSYDREISYPCLMDGIDDFGENILYISDKPEIPATAPVNLVYMTDSAENVPDAISGNNNTVSFLKKDGITGAAVLTAILRIMSYYNEWSDKLTETVKQGGNYFDLLETAHEVFGNPMIIYDASMKILAYTRNDGSDDEMWTDTVSAGTAKIENEMDSEELKLFVNKIENSTGPFVHRGKGMSDPFYTAVISANSKRLGVVTEMERHHVIGPGELKLLQTFCGFVYLMMQRDNEGGGKAKDKDSILVDDLIHGRISSGIRLATRMTALGWNTLKYYTLIQFVPSVTYVTYDHRKRLLKRLLALNLNGRGCLADNDRNGMFYILTHSGVKIGGQVSESIENFCRENNLRCAMSDTYEYLPDTGKYVKQTDAVLELSADTVKTYNDIRFSHMLSTAKKNDGWDDMLHPAVRILADSDTEFGTEYIKTLSCYIENQYHQVDTSACLAIHRTTLLYRLGKISEISGLDINNADEMLHVAVSLKLIK